MRGSYVLSARAVAETLAISAPTMLDSVLGRGSFEACDARLSTWSRRVVEAARIELSLGGREHLAAARPGETFVIMSNHRSHYDIPVLFDALRGRTLRMVTKTELFRIPLFGPAMRAAGFIEIDRGNRERAIASLREAKRTLARGVDVWIAPEGTRTRDAVLAPFKKGGFVLALETGLRCAVVCCSVAAAAEGAVGAEVGAACATGPATTGAGGAAGVTGAGATGAAATASAAGSAGAVIVAVDDDPSCESP
jgi:1-acyl-sn-glycerol-3-phosphate acyltransferase